MLSRRFAPVFMLILWCLWVSICLMLLFEGIFCMSHSFLSYIVFACQPFLIHLLVFAHLVRPCSSKLSSVVEYIMFVVGGFLNSLLPTDSIPLNFDHLLWIRDLDSIECLDTCIDQWQVLSPSTILGIHQCPLIDGFFQVFNLNTSIHTC